MQYSALLGGFAIVLENGRGGFLSASTAKFEPQVNIYFIATSLSMLPYGVKMRPNICRNLYNIAYVVALLGTDGGGERGAHAVTYWYFSFRHLIKN